MTAQSSRARSATISVSPVPTTTISTYFERCWRGSDWIERHELERIFVEGDEAFVTYRCAAKGGKTFRNTEFFVFESDKVKRIDVYFGAAYDNGAFVKQSG
jgi:hypothetical protein